MSNYAQIVVERSHKDIDRLFTYKIPMGMKLELGHRVSVSFGAGAGEITGFVVGFSDEIDFDPSKLKEISRVLEDKPVITQELISLAGWMKEKYYCTLADCIKCIIPPRITQTLGRTEEYAGLNYEHEDFDAAIELLLAKNNMQSRVVDLLLKNGDMPVSDIRAYLGISAAPIKTLQKNSIVRTERVERLRDTIDYDEGRTVAPVLMDSQKAAVEFVTGQTDGRPVLIHGVTGSGKTEIYMELIRCALEQGKDAIMLVPEISLTPQAVSLFQGRFGQRVSVTHSRLSIGERYDQWRKARDGKISIMIGPRSAVFTPFQNLGIIIIDEEHENTYKSEVTPKYSAKEVAIERCRLTGAKLVLGSATPAVETYFETGQGEIHLVTITERVNNRLPDIHVVDMRRELADGNKSIFSVGLMLAIEDALAAKKQIILFLNRRGYSTFVSCRRCGAVMKCENCNVNYTYHMHSEKLLCHYCGAKEKNPENCPVCGSKFIRYFGVGTQRVERELAAVFPGAAILRMDMDTTGGKFSHQRILESFRQGEAQVLVGTQMIAKGLDFPNVTVVGVIAADLSLNNGDYRAAEVTYQLLTQVSGRAGRADSPGQVFIQTYNPEHYSIATACANDYQGFFRHEIGLRRQMSYPPFTKIFVIVFTGEDEKKIIISQFKLLDIMKLYNRKGLFEMVGPAPASVSKIKKQYRWRLVVKSEDEEKLKAFVFYCLNKLQASEDMSGITVNVTLNPALLI